MNPLRELRFAGRTLRRSPGSALIAALALGVGIGLSTLMFSITQATMLRGLPFDAPDELVMLTRVDRAGGGDVLPLIQDWAAWRDGARTFDGLGAFLMIPVNIGGGAQDLAQRVSGARLTPSTLRLLGVRPVIGRLFDDADDIEGAPSVILIGSRLWRERFGGDPGVIGRTVRANGTEAVIVGVLPEDFGFPFAQQVWQPLGIDADRTAWGTRSVQVIGRLRDGVTFEVAAQDLDAITARIAEEHPETHADQTVRVARFGALGEQDRTMLFIMLAAVAGVLIIACVNVANLLIGRAIVRTKEVGIRMALGASRWRVALPFLAESAVLAAAGAAIAVAVAYAGNAVFVRSLEVIDPPFWLRWGIDGGTLVFVASAGAVAAMLAGVIPALQAAGIALHVTLKDESRGTSSFRLGRLGRGLVVAEIALSAALLVGAGLVVRSARALTTFDLGVPAERVFIARVALPASAYPEPDARRRFAAELETRILTLPGVEAVSLSSSIPGRYSSVLNVEIEGATQPDSRDLASARVPTVSTGYHTLFAEGPIRGRPFLATDDAGSPPVALVNEAFERRWLDGQSAVGRRIRLGDASSPWSTVVGTVPDLHENGVENAPPPAVYRPLAQAPITAITIAARTSARPLDLAGPVRDLVAVLDPDLPVYDAATLRSAISADNFRLPIAAGLFGTFGASALLLSAVGLYGVMSFSVGQRRREVGVRMAIGARPADVLRLVVLEGLRQVGIGLAAGAVLAVGLGRLMAWALFRIGPADPATFLGIGMLMGAVALVACGVPALAAARVDPLESLRSE